MSGNASDRDSGRVFRRTLAAMAAIGIGLVTWNLLQLLLLIFASALVAVMIHDFAQTLRRWLKLPFFGAITLAVLLPLVALLIVFGLFGTIMYDQFVVLAEDLPERIQDLTRWLRSSAPGRQALEAVNGYAPRMEALFGIAQSALTNIGSAASGLAIVVVAGIYLAAQPMLYIDGMLSMLSPEREAVVRHTLHAIRRSLTAWLKAQAVGMAFVAVGTSIGLTLVGMPSGLALGLVAGLCEFVPYLGIVLVSLPAILIGFGIDAQTGWLTILVLVIVQQVQGNVVSPMAQRQMADLPPAVTIFSLIGFGILCGPLGIVLAVPMTVVALAIIKANHIPHAPTATPQSGMERESS